MTYYIKILENNVGDIILDIDKLEEKIINSNKLIGIKIKSSLNSLINSIKNDINYFLND